MTAPAQSYRQRANVYIDGFNLYHGCFDDQQNRPHWGAYRWLNLASLCDKLCPDFEVVTIRYFTALVDPLPDNPHNRDRQLAYLRALDTIPNLEIHRGRFATTLHWRVKAQPNSKPPTPVDPLEKVCVIEREEKGSDVNLASYLLMDGFQRDYDVGVVITNDSDLAEPIRLIKEMLGLRVEIINPRKRVAADLQGIADSYSTIREWMVRESQFADRIKDEHGLISRPDTW